MLDRPATPATTPTTVPLSRLRFGDDKPGGGINARAVGRRDGLGELKASLLHHGLIQPLVVEFWSKRDVFVIEGNRRLAALKELATEKRLPRDHAVKVSTLDPGTNPMEASLAANILRLPMHEIDQHEAFARLEQDGQSAFAIASRFGTTEILVRRRLALGRLSPTIRAAWREGKIPVDAAQAFTIVADVGLQDQTYRALARGGNLYRSAVIRALTGGEQSWTSRRNLLFVGQRRFTEAGGRMAEDLFEPDEPKVLDPELLLRLAREKVEGECRRLVADDGWRWAVWDQDLPAGHYGWPRADLPDPMFGDDQDAERADYARLKARTAGEAEDGSPVSSTERRNASYALTAMQRGPLGLRACPPEIRAVTGCKVAIDPDGALRIGFGFIRPEDAAGQADGSTPAEDFGVGPAAAAPATPPTAAAPPAGISAALSETLSEIRTKAAAGALASDPALALRLVVATLQSSRSPARITARGYAGLFGRRGVGSQTWPHRLPDFEQAFALTEGAEEGALLDELAALVAASLDLTDNQRDHEGAKVTGQDALVAALDPGLFLAEARQTFDPEAFFDRVPSRLITAAIAEMGGEAPTGARKADLVGHAAALARETGWLPEPLRCAGFRLVAAGGDA